MGIIYPGESWRQGVSGRESTGWNPMSLATEASVQRWAWHDAGDLSTLFQDDGITPARTGSDPIGKILDKSGNGYHYTASASARPVLKLAALNGKPVIRFDGSNDALSAIKLDLTNNVSKLRIFAVVKYTSSALQRYAVLHLTSGAGGRAGMGVGTVAGTFFAGGRRLDADGSFLTTSGGTVFDAAILQDSFFNYAEARLVSFARGMRYSQHTSFQTPGSTSASNSSSAYFGFGGGNATAFDLAEVIQVVGNISELLVAQIRYYLHAKWGVEFGGIDGAFTWFNDPRAIALEDEVLLGSVGSSGAILAGLDSRVPIEMNTSLAKDDHNNPSFLVRASDQRVLAFYTGHNYDGMFMRISATPAASSWGAEVDISPQIARTFFSYTNPVQLTGETDWPIYLFFRCDPDGTGPTTYSTNYSKSLDGGVTWSEAQELFTGLRPYVKLAQNGDSRIDFLVSDGHPGEVATNSVYHCYYQAGSFYKSDGTLIAAPLPLTPATHMTKIWDGTTNRGWVWEIVIGADGHPAVAYTSFASTTDHRYRYARWNGSSWTDAEVVAAGTYLYAGEPYYSGGICIDPENVNVVYCSREVSGLHELYRYETADGGATWTGVKIAETSGMRSFRPFVVRGARKLAFVTGTYPSYTTFDTQIQTIDIET